VPFGTAAHHGQQGPRLAANFDYPGPSQSRARGGTLRRRAGVDCAVPVVAAAGGKRSRQEQSQDDVGTVSRYGESVLAIPVTISAFDMARHVVALTNAWDRDDVTYRVEGKLQGGLFGTRRFIDEGVFQLNDEIRNPATE